ncbi:MAG: YgiQ family radical SAM protein [Muribaculaceae bacterium]|nr:YgiQ family radical SAM protein [Muribaculaceae bacterium]
MKKINYSTLKPSDWLPTSVKEMKALGWDYVDVVLFSGDAYVDHPAFGAAVIGRTLQEAGYRVAIVPQPNWQDDLRDFRKFGVPRLFFGISPGAMDSMVNHYTAARRRRSDDAYTPGGRHGARPDYPTIVYSDILRSLYPDVPVVAGGIEASLRRLSHYDYWQDRLRPSILADCKADLIMYGMGERTVLELARRLADGDAIAEITDLPQTVVRRPLEEIPAGDADNIVLASFEQCLKDKKAQALNFKHIEQQSNRYDGGATLWQATGGIAIKVNPMLPAMDQGEIDAAFDLPYTRLPHPRYRGKTIPAYEMIRHSVNLHRGCFGGCAFCTISAHQGKFIASRSMESIIREVRQVTEMPDFKGYISDLGGPSANMYAMGGRDKEICRKCLRPSCLHPSPCRNLNTDHRPLLQVYHAADAVPGVKKSFIGSGVRYDLSMHHTGIPEVDRANERFNRELITDHVSGRLKVAPEHTSDAVLAVMRKPSFSLFHDFKALFDSVNTRAGLRQQLIPYFISSHPGCRAEDMAMLAAETKELNFHLEQVQDFTPTPMTLATEIYYTGYHPYTGEQVYTAVGADAKLEQRKFFFWYDPDYRRDITATLHRIGRPDLIARLFGSVPPHRAGVKSGHRPSDAPRKDDSRRGPASKSPRKGRR